MYIEAELGPIGCIVVCTHEQLILQLHACSGFKPQTHHNTRESCNYENTEICTLWPLGHVGKA